jgi:DNA-binding helix-hairpin-helix protein with protein kinase domain
MIIVHYRITKSSDEAASQLNKLKNLAEMQLTEARSLRRTINSSEPFSWALRDLATKRDRYVRLSDLRSQKVDELRTALQEHQLHDFLSTHRIEDAFLQGIGHRELIALESNGIENAEDLSILGGQKIPGLQPYDVSTLEKWRRSLSDRYRFQHRLTFLSADLATLEAEISNQKLRLQKELRSGPAHLRQISQQVLDFREAGHPSVRDCRDAYLKVQAHLNEASPKFWIGVAVSIYVLNLLFCLLKMSLKH